jgi:hypothetical protein
MEPSCTMDTLTSYLVRYERIDDDSMLCLVV